MGAAESWCMVAVVSARSKPCVPVTRGPFWALLCATMLAASACSGSLRTAVDAYNRADYPGAARAFAHVSFDDPQSPELGRFHLYCGLNHLALGNTRLAVVHLTHARATLDQNPLYFSTDERARMLGAWRTLGRMPGQSLLP